MQRKSKIIIFATIIIIITTWFFSTQHKNKEPFNESDSLWPKSFALNDIYKSIMDDVWKIELRSGSSGEIKIITDSEEINKIIEQLRTVNLKLKANQEDRTGWIYSIKCLNTKGDKWFLLVIGGSAMSDNFRTNHEISSPYYNISNTNELVSEIDSLFNGKE